MKKYYYIAVIIGGALFLFWQLQGQNNRYQEINNLDDQQNFVEGQADNSINVDGSNNLNQNNSEGNGGIATSADSAQNFLQASSTTQVEELLEMCAQTYTRFDQQEEVVSINDILKQLETAYGEIGDKELINEEPILNTSNSENITEESFDRESVEPNMRQTYSLPYGEREKVIVVVEDSIPVEIKIEREGKTFQCKTVNGSASCACL